MPTFAQPYPASPGVADSGIDLGPGNSLSFASRQPQPETRSSSSPGAFRADRRPHNCHRWPPSSTARAAVANSSPAYADERRGPVCHRCAMAERITTSARATTAGDTLVIDFPVVAVAQAYRSFLTQRLFATPPRTKLPLLARRAGFASCRSIPLTSIFTELRAADEVLGPSESPITRSRPTTLTVARQLACSTTWPTNRSPRR